jgi:poly(beta-D-mannuronate) lyase
MSEPILCGWTNNSFAKHAKYALFLAVLAAAAAVFAVAQAKSFRSPWDGKPVTITEAAYACPAIAHIAPDLVTDGFYRLDDPTHFGRGPSGSDALRQSNRLCRR